MKTYKRARHQASTGKDPQENHDYRGYVLSPDHGVGKVRYSDLSSDGFFEEFVAPRKPVVIDGHLAESEGWRGGQWTNEYLRDKAGDAEVKVEFRGGAGERFGQGLERGMKFGDFLGELEHKSDLLYLTTQELRLDPTGRPALMSAPLDRLRDDFPLRPKLVGELVPQNVNLWMGHTKSGASSSGLHHDFHDNLYVLLRGKKTFRLFSPADAHRMYLEGDVVKVHPNGRINYRGKETLADGSDPLAETAAKAAELVDRAALKAEEVASDPMLGGAAAPGDRASDSEAEIGQQDGERDKLAVESRKSEKEVASAQAALDRGEIGAAERLAAAEEELERALEAVLDAECAGGGGYGDGSSGDSSSDSDGGPGFFDGINDDPSEEAFLAASAGRKNGGLSSANGVGHGAGENVEDDGDEGNHRDGGDGVEMATTAKMRAGDDNGGQVSSGGAETKGGGKAEQRRIGGGGGGDGGGQVKARGSSTITPCVSENGGGTGVLGGVSDRVTKRKKSERGREQEGADEQEEDRNKQERDEGQSKGDPPANFSKVDPSLPRAELAERFPLFLGAESRTVEVEAGQMLYLPAGWFHEVSSAAAENGHLAFNYWFHPPDTLSSSAPYESTFWRKDWEARERDGAEDGGGYVAATTGC